MRSTADSMILRRVASDLAWRTIFVHLRQLIRSRLRYPRGS
jgi:hypothetical protein